MMSQTQPDSAAIQSGPPAPGARATERAALRGSTITLAAYGISSLVRFASNLIITRLLIPEQFGIMALVNVVITGLVLFSDIGIGVNIIQSPRGDDPRFLNTAWTVQVIRGFVLWSVAGFLAWPLARFYARPELFFLIPVAGFGAVIAGFESTRLHTQNRKLVLGRISAIELMSQITNIVVMITLAKQTHSVWSLVLGVLAGGLAKTILSHTVLPGVRNGFAWDPSAWRAVIAFGRWIFVSTAFTFLASQSDRLILGKMVSSDRLGLYSIASNLAMLPSYVIGLVANRVLYPLVAESLRSPDHDWSRLLAFRSRVLLGLGPLMALGIVLAPPFVSLLYPTKYHEVGPLVSYMLIGAWLNTISLFYTITLLASGVPKYMSVGNFAKTVLFASFVFVVAPRFGIGGVAVLVSFSELAFLAVALAGCRRLGVIAWKTDLARTAFGVAYFVACKLAYETMLRVFGGRILPAMGVVTLATGGLVLAQFKQSRWVGMGSTDRR